MGPVGGGLALIEALGGYVDERQGEIEVFYETSARELISDGDGAIVGVKAVGRGNKLDEFRDCNVILASGGYQGNQEMLSHYVGPQAQFVRSVSRGGHYNRGAGVRVALSVGAAPCGDYSNFHAQPVDPRSTDIEPAVFNYSYGILINDAGLRFTDEAPGMVDATYEEVARLIMKQRHGIAFPVFDAKLEDVEKWPMTVRSRVPPIEAESLSELASAMGVDERDFLATVETYNRACPKSEWFDPLQIDGLSTINLEPRKSHWARPISQGPFRAWPMICSNCFTFGGVKIDERARVINADGDAIPGLYAADEVAGIYYRVYTGATSVMRGAVMGRLVGSDAALRRNAIG